MGELTQALNEMADFASHPPAPTPPRARLEKRVARRRRRRRSFGAGAGLLLLGVAGFWWIGQEDPVTDVRTENPDAVERPPADDLLVEPATDLQPDDLVTITLPVEPFADALVVQCASEAVGLANPESWCDLSGDRVSTGGDGDFQFQVLRSIQTSNGLIDCAERPQRCVIGVRSGGRDYTGPISFAADTRDLPTASIELSQTQVADGDRIQVTGTGFVPGVEVWLSQCFGEVSSVDQPSTATGVCDLAGTLFTQADGSGSISIEMVAYREILGDGWLPCEPCFVHASTSRQEPAKAVVEVAPTDSPLRPTVTITPSGPYRPGQRVTLRGDGFRPGSKSMDIGWCAFNTEHPELEAQGAGPDYALCRYPYGPIDIDDDTGFAITDFPMPSADWGLGVSCERTSDQCALAWHPSEGSPPAFITYFETLPE